MGDKTNQLHRGQVLLPPEVFLVLGSEAGDQIVRVHDDVDEGVDNTKESAVAAWKDIWINSTYFIL